MKANEIVQWVKYKRVIIYVQDSAHFDRLKPYGMRPSSLALRTSFDMEIAKAKAKYAHSNQASMEMQSKVPLQDEAVEDICH